MGKVLIVIGLCIIAVGIYVSLGGKFSGWGHLPGDISFTSGNTSFYFPIVTCALVSILATILLNLFSGR